MSRAGWGAEGRGADAQADIDRRAGRGGASPSGAVLERGGDGVELAESAAHARRVDRKGLALAIVAPQGLGGDGEGLVEALRSAIGPVIVLADAADEAGLPARVATALEPAGEADEAAPLLQFAGYSLDVAGRSLTDESGKEMPLTQSEFGLLLAFAQRASRVLSRDQLLQILAGRDAEAFDRSIDTQIVRLRRKIEPDPKTPSLIVTVTGAGYKFAAKVRQAGTRPASGPAASATAAAPAPARRDVQTPDAQPPGTEPSSEPLPAQGTDWQPEPVPLTSRPPLARRSGHPTRLRLFGAVGVLAVAICGLVVWKLWPASRAPASAIPAVAVLPFENLSGDPADGRMADGVTEDIILTCRGTATSP